MQNFTKVWVAGAAIVVFGTVYFIDSEQEPKAVVQLSSTDTSEPNMSSLELNSMVQANRSAANGVKDWPLETQNQTRPELSEEEVMGMDDDNPNYGKFSDRVNMVSARRNGRAVDPVALWEASQEETLWKPLDEAPDSLNLSLDQKLDGREFIKVSALKLESLVPGDTLDVTVAQLNKTFTATIEKVRSEDDGQNVTWSGHIEGMEAPNFLTLTRGDNLIIGGISTPTGLYNLQANGEVGWIVDSSTLFVGGDHQIEVPQHLIDNPSDEVIHLPVM